ncbi:hypothetical protein M9H77_27194 [Catharanthus roseus]|uniref:Uncharacterized protein n=1 Tax=Catharanthus roseus TaxID=4058 RepID=A0ACC0ACU0_CATRO|nr:hypothetical protein M9H77_27194 [Catharanthus roseus]
MELTMSSFQHSGGEPCVQFLFKIKQVFASGKLDVANFFGPYTKILVRVDDNLTALNDLTLITLPKLNIEDKSCDCLHRIGKSMSKLNDQFVSVIARLYTIKIQLENLKDNPKATNTCRKSSVPIDRAKEGESLHSLYHFERPPLGPQLDAAGKLKAMRKELMQMKRKRSQNKEMYFGKFGNINNLLSVSGFEDVDNIGNEFESRFVMRTLAPRKWLEDVVFIPLNWVIHTCIVCWSSSPRKNCSFLTHYQQNFIKYLLMVDLQNVNKTPPVSLKTSPLQQLFSSFISITNSPINECIPCIISLDYPLSIIFFQIRE